jgi:hypothetical protein
MVSNLMILLFILIILFIVLLLYAMISVSGEYDRKMTEFYQKEMERILKEEQESPEYIDKSQL